MSAVLPPSAMPSSKIVPPSKRRKTSRYCSMSSSGLTMKKRSPVDSGEYLQTNSTSPTRNESPGKMPSMASLPNIS